MDTPIRAVVHQEGTRLLLNTENRERLKALAGEAIEIRKVRKARSSPQNRRYWALLTVAAESLWGDRSQAEALHEEIAHLLLALPPCEKTGLRRRMRTPKLNTREFAQYCDRVVDKLIELGADLTGWDEEERTQERAA